MIKISYKNLKINIIVIDNLRENRNFENSNPK